MNPLRLFAAAAALVSVFSSSAFAAKKFHPGHYMLLSDTISSDAQHTLMSQEASDRNLIGFQIRYSWAELEVAKNDYSGIAATIGRDLTFVAGLHKQLVVQVQYKSIVESDIPSYITSQPNGVVEGSNNYWVPNFWDTGNGIRNRFNLLLEQIASQYDGNANLELVILAESATGLDGKSDYSPTGWVSALNSFAVNAVPAFAKTTFEEYINFISGDQSQVGPACANVINAGGTFGGPDIDPGASIPAYSYYSTYAPPAHLGSAVQSADYTDGSTTEQIFSFATSSTLHVSYIFWLNNAAHWPDAKATIAAHAWPWY